MTKKVKRLFQIGASIILVVFSIAFATANLEKVKISYLLGSTELYVCVLVFFALLIGGGLGVLLRYPMVYRLKRDNIRLRKKLKTLTDPPRNLKAIPLQKEA